MDPNESWVKRMVVAVDSSPASVQGLRIAVDVARRTGARVTVVHVRHTPAGGALAPGVVQWGLVEETLEALQTDSRVAAEEAFGGSGVDWEFRTVDGSPGEEILKLAREVGADLVVVGSNRHTSVRNLLLGSTSAYLASHSPTAVLVARPTSLDGSNTLPRAGMSAAAGVSG